MASSLRFGTIVRVAGTNRLLHERERLLAEGTTDVHSEGPPTFFDGQRINVFYALRERGRFLSFCLFRAEL